MQRKILIVDDYEMNRDILRDFLETDYEIIEAKDGVEALKILCEEHKTVSAVLLDINMPEMDGYEVLERMHADQNLAQIPVIVLTSNLDEQSEIKALRLGAIDFVTKPFNSAIIKQRLTNAIHMRENATVISALRRDELTGLFNRETFFDIAAEMISAHEAGYFVLTCFDVDRFKVINDQYGTTKGDELLKYIAKLLLNYFSDIEGICSRLTADDFAVLYPAKYMDSEEIKELHRIDTIRDINIPHIDISIGRYVVDDLSLSVSAMYDRAILALSSVKGRFDSNLAVYDESMRTDLLFEQEIIAEMSDALCRGEFEVWYQPQYNHASGALVGVESLVRWHHPKKGVIPPYKFIPIFENNGFIYELDKYVWEQSAALVANMQKDVAFPVPVSVNVSRYDALRADFFEVFSGIVKKYDIPVDMLRVEITESAFSESTMQIIDVAKRLINSGFTVEIDDFGSGYSSLNTLKDVPAQVLKLDMRFFEKTEDTARGGNIVESVVRMAKWLGMTVIAEGVETREQADYLQSIGCIYIQGYLYARPMQREAFVSLIRGKTARERFNKLETVENLDNSRFWDPKSMETLIFNSYVGGACIFEYHNGKTELLRMNERYTKELGGLIESGLSLPESSLVRFLDDENKAHVVEALDRAIEKKEEAFCEVKLQSGDHVEYVRITVRLIARVAERYLFYCVIVNNTKQRETERRELENAEQLKIIMDNINGGVSAILIEDDGSSRFVFNNDKYYELYGYTKDEARKINLDVMTTILPEDFSSVMEKVKKLKADGVPTIIDYRCKRKDGKLAYLRANSSLMKMEGFGEVITSVVTDITEKRELEEQLRAIVDNIDGGVSATVMINGKLEFVVVNDRFFNILGCATREEYDALYPDKYAGIFEEDRERIRRQFETSDGGKTKYTMEYRVVRRDGEIRYVKNNISVITLFGIDGPVQLSVENDVTEQYLATARERRISNQLNAITANLHGGIMATLFRGRDDVEIAFCNRGFYEMYGYTKEQFDAEVKNPLDLIVPEDRERTAKIAERVTLERGTETYEYRCEKRGGGTMWVQCTNSVISIEGLGENVLLAIMTDITALRLAQQKSVEASDRFRTVLDHAGNGITAIALNKDKPEFLFSNDVYYEIVGYTREQYDSLTRDDMFAAIAPEDKERMRTVVTEMNEKEGSYTVEYRVVQKSGKKVWVKSVITITRLTGVEVPVQIAMFSDVTAEKEAEAQLKFLNDSAHDILAQADTEVAVNKTLENLLTYFDGDRAYVFELDYDKRASNNTYEKCADGVESEIAFLQNVPFAVSQYWFDELNQKRFISIDNVDNLGDDKAELRLILLQQDIHSIIIAPLWRDGVLMGYAGIDNPKRAANQLDRLKALADYIAILLTRRDLDAKIASDQKNMNALMHDTPGGYVRMKVAEDGTFVPVYANDGFKKLLGLNNEQLHEAFGGDALRGVFDEDKGIVEKAGRDMLEKGEAESARFRVKNGAGEYVWLTLNGRMTRDVSGETYLNVYYSDVTGQVEEEDRQKELLDNLPCGAALYEVSGGQISIIHINKTYWQLVDREPDAHALTSVVDMVHEDDKSMITEELSAAIRQKRNVSVSVRIRCGKSGYKPFHIDAKITPDKNGKYRLFAAYTPIT